MQEQLLALTETQASESPVELDLTNAQHLALVTQFADDLLAMAAPPATYADLEKTLVARGDQVPLSVHLAVKLALSRSRVQQLTGPAHLSIVFAVYKEHQRILSSDEVAGGEDFLRRKVDQLDWLFAGREDLTWDMVVVDDGCPEDSGGIAQRLIDENRLGDRVKVLFLADAIQKKLAVIAPLTDTSESMKGGSVALGLWTAAEAEHARHVVAFTDADLSTHLGQSGLLMSAILDQGADAAIGSRRLPASVVIKKGARNDRGKLFIYLWKRLIANLPDIVDTQCGFKAFRAETVRRIVPDMLEKKFAFDIELLVKTTLQRPESISQVPIAWIDSDVLSTTTDLQPYLPMLKAIAGMYRAYLEPSECASGFAAFIDEMDDVAWERLLNNVPREITDREPLAFLEYDGVDVAMLRRAAGRLVD